eukprot:gnl/Chilomastix_caulleri/1798.p1 GENE.gnl/Chilomastix_caulleri/1798~~gnl/Chilomastix_caulleri/1798.p1  ORF type:complete len:133 (+),score=1.35 gnl/Chilomastix_caulleri/1798:112-510(+)
MKIEQESGIKNSYLPDDKSEELSDIPFDESVYRSLFKVSDEEVADIKSSKMTAPSKSATELHKLLVAIARGYKADFIKINFDEDMIESVESVSSTLTITEKESYCLMIILILIFRLPSSRQWPAAVQMRWLK